MHQTTPTVYGKLIYTIGVATLLYNVNLNESFTLCSPRLTENKFRFVHHDFFSHFSNPPKNWLKRLTFGEGSE